MPGSVRGQRRFAACLVASILLSQSVNVAQATDPPSEPTLPPLPAPPSGADATTDSPPSGEPSVQTVETAASDTFGLGDVFVSVGSGRVQWRLPDGQLNATLDTGAGGYTTGLTFDSANRLYVTAFTANTVYRFEVDGSLIGQFGSGYNCQPESLVFDSGGNMFAGEAQCNRDIVKFEATGTTVARFDVAIQNVGADWIDLEPDDCTMRYTSEGSRVLRFDVCTNTQLPDFAGGLTRAFAIAILPDDGLLVADDTSVHRLNASGQVIDTYDASGENCWFNLALDPDGASFWAADRCTSNVYKFDIDSGAQLLTFNTGTANDTVFGLAVSAGFQVAENGPPDEQTLGDGSSTHDNDPTRRESDPVNTATGNYVHQTTDLSFPGRGIDFAFTRTYNSLDATATTLGPGWTHSFAARLAVGADGSVRFVSEDGGQLLYLPDGSGGFVAPPGAHSILTQDANGYELVRRDQVRYRFDAAGVLLSQTDRNGNSLGFGYASGLLTQITDTVGRTVDLSYDADGRLTGLSDPLGRSVAYTYEAGGRLVSATDLSGETYSYTYDANGRLATVTDPLGNVVVSNEYGSDGRVIAQTDARGNRGTFAWDEATEVSTYTDANGATWIDDYFDNMLVSHTDPLGNVTSYTYEPDFNRSIVTDPRGNIWRFSYDANSNLLTRTAPSPLSYVEKWTYTARNDIATYTDGRRNTTTFEYDTNGNLIKETRPDGSVVTYGRDPDGTGLLTSITDSRGKTTTFAYDANANLFAIATPLGNRTSATYDAAGRKLTQTDPRGNLAGADPSQFTTAFAYDASDRLVSVTDPLGNGTSWTYDAAGNRTSQTDANNDATSWAYDATYNLVGVTDAAGGVTAYAYDAVHNLVSRTDASARVATYGYDAAHRLSVQTDPLGNQWSFAYDAAGNVTARTDANAKTTTFTYDVLNRLIGITYADSSTPAVSFAYDANSNRTSMSDGAGTESLTYDALNRLLSATRGSDAFRYTYDAAGNLLSRTYPDTTVTSYAYDDDSRLASAASGGATASYAYDAAANLLDVTTPDGWTARHTWDRAGRLLEVAHVNATATLARATYQLDAVGNRVKLTTTRETQLFTYDALDRLTGICYDACPSGGGGGGTISTLDASALECIACTGSIAALDDPDGQPIDQPSDPADTHASFTYDPVGNRLSHTDFEGTTTYAYDAADRLISVTAPDASVTPYGFDANGNQVSAGADSFAYDLADRLSSATVAGTTETYAYAGDGVRLSAATGSQANRTTRFVVDRNLPQPSVALERNGNDQLRRRYTYGLDLLSLTTSNKGPFWYHHDGLGSVTDLTAGDGGSLAWYEYQPFGELRAMAATSQAPPNPMRFTGEYLDEPTGLYHLRARQYDPSLGRFLTQDPAAAPISDPYVASYVYVRNNPMNWVDPTGMAREAPRAYDAGMCLAGIYGFTALELSAFVMELAGLGLQGASITLWGVTYGASTPVTAGGIALGASLEVAGAATAAAGLALLVRTCFAQ